MRKIIFLIAVIVTCFPSFVMAAQAIQSEKELRDECSEESASMVDMRKCLEIKLQVSESSLKESEQAMRLALNAWDEETRYIKQAQTRLDKAGKSFIAFRKSHCEFAYSLGGGAIGNALDMGRIACMAELNNTRAQQLNLMASDIRKKN